MMVRATTTHLTGDQAADALIEAYETKFGSPPPKETIAVLTAHWAHETGSGASMLNFNFGGIKGTSPDGLSAAYRTREGSGAQEIKIVDRFRAYTSATTGAEDYLGLLERKYPEALDAARSGDPGGFVRQLKSKGYFTGNERQYVRSVTRMTNQALTDGPGALTAAGLSPGATVLRFDRLESLPPSQQVRTFGLPAGTFDHSRAADSFFALSQENLGTSGLSFATDEVARSALRVLISAHQRESSDRPHSNSNTVTIAQSQFERLGNQRG